MSDYSHFKHEATNWQMSGWDFSMLADRCSEESPNWDYRSLVEALLPTVSHLLDMGTGGGEFLSSLTNLPTSVDATESWEPNVAVARAQLSPLGISVHPIQNDQLPFEAEQFDLIINRHDSFDATEVSRVLKPGGLFVTQQVGGQDNQAINNALAPKTPNEFADWSLERAVSQLQNAGLHITRQEECFPETRFLDIGALMLYLKAIPWQVPGFSLETHECALQQIHQHIIAEGSFKSLAHRFLVVASKQK